MASPNSRNVVVRFGPFEANLSTQELQKFGTRLRVPNQSFQVLALLLEHPGQLVTRDELRQELWASDTFVEYDQGLNAAVNRLRDVLGDSAEKPRYIETLPRRGYRFLAQTELISQNSEPAATAGSTSSPPAAPVAEEPISAEPVLEKPPERQRQERQRLERQRLDRQIPAAAPSSPAAQSTPTTLPATDKLQMVAIIVLCALIVTTVTVWFGRRSFEPNFSSVKVTPFTSLPGQEVAPTFSPDGSQVAFALSSSLDQGFDLYVKTIGSERTIKLTQHPARWIAPAWSPDGTKIAFARWAPDANGIFVIPALGGPERKLADANFWYEPFMQISWSPDSKSLAFWSAGEGGSHIFVLSVDDLHQQMIDPGLHCWDMASPSFSPDGTNLAFVCTSSIAVYGIYELPFPGRSPRLLTSMMGYFRGLTWSADGRRIVFSNDSGDGGSLWQVDMGGRLAKLPFGEEGSNPSVASRGNRLAYVRGSKTVDIWRLDLTSRAPENSATKLIYSTRIQRVPQYSPDGKEIVFESDRSGTHEIWLADADGNNLVQLTSFNGPQTGAPVWCSDGHRVAFDSRASGSSAIYIEDVSERVPRQIKTNVPNLAVPACSENCQWLVAGDGHHNLYRVPAAGGAAIQISDKPSWFSVVQDGRIFFNVKTTNRVALWSRAVSGGEAEPLKAIPELDATESWTATARGIYFTLSSSTPAAVNFYDFSTQTVRRLSNLPRAPTPGGGLSVSPDGRWLLYTQTDDAQSVIMLANDFR
jgi:Tol biopolymer transport system component/DNA-binding winged helix-turn-helix (wHTH) protein